MPLWTGTIRKLLIAVGALVLFHAAGPFFSALGLREVHEALRSTNRQAETQRLALELASAVRDQYAHQAHTIIIGVDSSFGATASGPTTFASMATATTR